MELLDRLEQLLASELPAVPDEAERSPRQPECRTGTVDYHPVPGPRVGSSAGRWLHRQVLVVREEAIHSPHCSRSCPLNLAALPAGATGGAAGEQAST